MVALESYKGVNMGVNMIQETVRSCEELKEYIGIIIKYSKINNRLNQDLFNEQLLNYFETKKSYSEERQANFKTYLTANLRNNLSNFIRDNMQNDDVMYKNDFLDFIPDNRKDTEKDLINREIVEEILEEINKLEFKKRYIIKQRIFAGKTFEEIGGYFNNSRQNISYVFNREIQNLRRKFGGRLC